MGFMLKPPGARRAHQQGAAIVSVLVLVMIATLLVASLFWRQHLGTRSILNRQAIAQLRWVESAVLDWAAVVLRADQNATGAVDHLQETWAVPVAETRLDETVTAGARISGTTRSALIAGQIFDAHARFNLSNLVRDGEPVAAQGKAYRRLLTTLGLPSELESALTQRLLQAYPGTGAIASLPPILKARDLLRVPGYDERILAVLAPYVIFLPKRIPGPSGVNQTGMTKINLNTAPAEVLAAMSEDIPIDAARGFVALRERVIYTSLDQAGSAISPPVTFSAELFSVGSSFFLLSGMVRFERVEASSEALFFRGPAKVELVWRQQY